MNVDEKPQTGKAPEVEQKDKRERSSLCKVLPTDRIAFDRQIEILRAYAACYESNGGKPVSNAQAGDTLTPKFSASTIGIAVPFFTDIALISKVGTDFVPSPELQAYNQALALSPPEAKRKIRPLLENTWFCRLLAPRLRLSQQTVADCVGLLAVESKAEKDHLPRVEPLIKFLEFAGIVVVSGGMVSFNSIGAETSPSIPTKLSNGPGANDEAKEDNGYHTYVLPLPKGRKITVKAPLDLTKSEIERLNKWAEFTLFLDWKDDKTQQQ
jgi:hypothetical protein